MVVQELESFGDLIKSEPPAESIESGEVEEGVSFWIAAEADADLEEIRTRALGVSEVATCEVEQLDDSAPEEAEEAPPAGDSVARRARRPVRTGPRGRVRGTRTARRRHHRARPAPTASTP